MNANCTTFQLGTHNTVEKPHGTPRSFPWPVLKRFLWRKEEDAAAGKPTNGKEKKDPWMENGIGADGGRQLAHVYIHWAKLHIGTRQGQYPAADTLFGASCEASQFFCSHDPLAIGYLKICKWGQSWFPDSPLLTSGLRLHVDWYIFGQRAASVGSTTEASAAWLDDRFQGQGKMKIALAAAAVVIEQTVMWHSNTVRVRVNLGRPGLTTGNSCLKSYQRDQSIPWPYSFYSFTDIWHKFGIILGRGRFFPLLFIDHFIIKLPKNVGPIFLHLISFHLVFGWQYGRRLYLV